MIAAWWLYGRYAPIARPPGVLVREEPEQVMVNRPIINHGKWQLKPLARYVIKVRVLSKHSYPDDALAELAPYDLAVGWGMMSDSAVLEEFSIRQSYRRFSWLYLGEAPLDRGEVVRHSANMHLIPADASVLEVIRGLRKGSIVKLNGFLVEAIHSTHPDQPCTSSLTRSDTGDGACEVMLVNSALELD